MENRRDRSKLSRRDFLATTAASVAAAGVMGAGCMDEMMSKMGKWAMSICVGPNGGLLVSSGQAWLNAK